MPQTTAHPSTTIVERTLGREIDSIARRFPQVHRHVIAHRAHRVFADLDAVARTRVHLVTIVGAIVTRQLIDAGYRPQPPQPDPDR